MAKKIYIVIIIMLAAFAFYGCSSKKTLSMKQVENILYDMHFADGVLHNEQMDGKTISEINRYDKIFEKYKCTRNDFETAIRQYSLRSGAVDAIYAHVKKRFENAAQEYDRQIALKNILANKQYTYNAEYMPVEYELPVLEDLTCKTLKPWNWADFYKKYSDEYINSFIPNIESEVPEIEALEQCKRPWNLSDIFEGKKIESPIISATKKTQETNTNTERRNARPTENKARIKTENEIKTDNKTKINKAEFKKPEKSTTMQAQKKIDVKKITTKKESNIEEI